MTIKEEIQIEEYKRTFAEAYRQGFKDALSMCKTELKTTFTADGVVFEKMDKPQTELQDWKDRMWAEAVEVSKDDKEEQ